MNLICTISQVNSIFLLELEDNALSTGTFEYIVSYWEEGYIIIFYNKTN